MENSELVSGKGQTSRIILLKLKDVQPRNMMDESRFIDAASLDILFRDDYTTCFFKSLEYAARLR